MVMSGEWLTVFVDCWGTIYSSKVLFSGPNYNFSEKWLLKLFPYPSSPEERSGVNHLF